MYIQREKPPPSSGGFSLCIWRIACSLKSETRLWQLDQPRIKQRFNGRERLQHRIGNRRVYLHHGERLHRLRSRSLAAQGEVADVDALLAQYGANPANHARHVQIAADE